VKQYIELIEDVLKNGIERGDRTGTGTLSVFGRTLRFDMSEGFPLVTTKKVPLRLPAEEMLWFLAGKCNNKDLQEKNISIWNEWANPHTGNLGPVYGVQWRHRPVFKADYIETGTCEDGCCSSGEHIFRKVGEIDQIKEAINQVRTNPESRRIIVEGWNVGQLTEMALPPCHKTHQLYCDIKNKKLSMALYIRSSDLGLGLPFNIAQYAFLLHMYAHVTGYAPGELIVNLGDTHVYLDHIEALTQQIAREPFKLPTLVINRPVSDIDDFKYEDFALLHYKHHPHIAMKVSV
jgi:thymidylate synthase